MGAWEALVMIDPDKILVTGGSGLVGSCVTGKHKPRSTEVDLMKFNEVYDYIRDNKIQYVVHCAARVGGVKDNSEKPAEFFYENAQMNLNILEACRLSETKKIVSIITTCSFPAKATYPLTVEQLHMGEPHESNYGYGYAKRMLAVQAKAYHEQYGMNIVSLIPCNVYGPRDNFNITSGHVVPSLIHKAYVASKAGNPLKVWGDGSPLRELLYSEDLGKIIDWFLTNYDDAYPVIVSPDEETSIKYVAEQLMSLYDIKELIFESEMPIGQHRKPSDNSKLKEILPDFEFTSFDSGLKKTTRWFNENFGNTRR